MSNYYYDVTSLMTSDITGVGVYTKQLFFSLRELDCQLVPVYKLSRRKNRKYIEDHIGVKAKAFVPFFSYQGLMHGTDFKLLSSSHRLRKILTIHDLAVFREDLLDSEFCRQGQEKFLKVLSMDPEAIIVPTEFVKNEMMERFPRWEKRVHSIYHGADHLQGPSEREGLGNNNAKYFLYVGRLEKRKNVKGLIEAFDQFCKTNSDVQLIVVGSEGFGAKKIFESLESSVNKSRIQLKGYVDNKELSQLYKEALAFVYPSLYEGFGIPIVEAMKMGIPVLTSNFGAMKEVGGDGVMAVDTLDKDAFSQSLSEIASNQELREQLSRRGQNRALEFTWEQTAESTLAVYEAHF